VLERVADPRQRRGVRHRVPAVLGIAVAATLAGARSFTAIGEWAADAPAGVLTRLGLTREVPSESTIRRLLGRLAPDQLDQVIGSWMWLRTSMVCGRRVIAFDGKTSKAPGMRPGTWFICWPGCASAPGSCSPRSPLGAKTNEILTLQTLLTTLDLTDAVVTADAMHCQRDTAHIIRDRGGHYILTVKNNQCATRRSDASPLQAGQTRREVCWVR
jgi:hypothetical protein